MSELSSLTRHFAQAHPDAFARCLAEADRADVEGVLDALSAATAVATIVGMPLPVAEQLIDGRADSVLIEWLSSAMEPDALRLINRVRPNRRARLVNEIGDPGRRRALDRALSVRSGAVGTLVDPESTRVAGAARMADVLPMLRSSTTPRTRPVVVVDAEDRVLGFLDPARAMFADPEATASTCVEEIVHLHADTAPRTAATAAGWQRHQWLPVVDSHHRLLGLIDRARLISDGASASAGTIAFPFVELGTSFLDVAQALTTSLIGTDER